MHSEEKQRPHGAEAYLTNKIGHATGRGIAKALWKKNWFRAIAAQHPGMMKLASEGLVALTSLLELGGDHPIVRLANFVTETLAMENLELLEEFEKNPDDPELAKKVEQKIGDAIEKAEKHVVVALEHIHLDENCAMVVQYVKDATPPSFSGKPGQPPRANPTAARLYPMSLTSALAAGKPLCGLCYPAVSVRKPEEKKEKSKEVVPGRNFMEHLMRLQTEEPEEFERFWRTLLLRLDGADGPDLMRKLQDAFNGRFGYEAFRFVVSMPHRNELGSEEWHIALDALLGKVTSPESWKKSIEGFIDEEKRQTEEMFRALFDWLGKSNKKRDAKIAEKEASIAKKREAFKQMVAARKRSGRVKAIVFLCLSAILASWYIVQHVDNNSARSDASEQKVEVPHVR